jgi:putative two-component system hydrogenase maturation factor HypX/HoxX
MRILLVAHGFNGLTQRLHAELRADGHELSFEYDIADSVTEEAVALWRPDVLIAPFMKRRIPASVWSRLPCLVVHPGPPGDRGPAALDWAVLDGAREWGVTVLQANGDYDAGPVWAAEGFALRAATKSSLYRREVTQAAVRAVRAALAHGGARAAAVAPGTLRAPPPPTLRTIGAAVMPAAQQLRVARAADGHPGAIERLFGTAVRVFDLHPASDATLARAPAAAPGTVVARRGPALLRRTVDGGVWIGRVRRLDRPAGEPPLKLAAVDAFAAEAAALPALDVPLERDAGEWGELRYETFGPPDAEVGWLRFDFHNGAMDSAQCAHLRDALRAIRARPPRVLVLAGGEDFFCNGIHLHAIESASYVEGGSAADASYANIQAIDDVVLEILTFTDSLTVAALGGNAGAGGCFVALAADRVWAHAGVVLNPHYKNMGNLYGSEYWTYTLPARAGAGGVAQVMGHRLPLLAAQARALGIVDEVPADDADGFEAVARRDALALAAGPDFGARLAAKRDRRARDEAARPLAAYRADELARMQRNFYGFDPSYHVARQHFVTRKLQAWTPRHLALHRA